MCGVGVSGAVSFPGYMMDTHAILLHDLLTNNDGDYTGGITTGVFDLSLETVLNAAWSSDAYSNFTFTSPTTDLAASRTQFDNYYSHVTALVHTSDWKDILTIATDKLGNCSIIGGTSIQELANSAIKNTTRAVEEALEVVKALVDDDILQSLVTQFDERQDIPRTRAIARFNQQMVDANAVHSSSFLLGHALLQSEHTRQTADYDAQINGNMFQNSLQLWIQGWIRQSQMESFTRQNNHNQKMQALREGVGQMVSMLMNEVSFENTAASLLTDQNRVKIVGLAEHEERDLARDVQADAWDIERMADAIQIMGGPAGAARTLPAKASRASSALGGALSGAAAGAAAGSVVPGLGTAAGAGVGALIGGVGGLLQ